MCSYTVAPARTTCQLLVSPPSSSAVDMRRHPYEAVVRPVMLRIFESYRRSREQVQESKQSTAQNRLKNFCLAMLLLLLSLEFPNVAKLRQLEILPALRSFRLAAAGNQNSKVCCGRNNKRV